MTWVIVIVVISIVSFVLQYFLSLRKRFWPGIIIPTVFLIATTYFYIMNLTDAFYTVEGYGLFLIEYGETGLFALILKSLFLYSPFIIQLIIFFVCRKIYRNRNVVSKCDDEIKKMIVNDLE